MGDKIWGHPDRRDRVIPHSQMPWSHYDDTDAAGKTGRHEVVTEGKTIAYIYETKGCEAEDAANAAIIAYSPDLLRACRLWADAIEIIMDGPDDSDRDLAASYMLEGANIAKGTLKAIEGRVADKAAAIKSKGDAAASEPKASP